MIDHAQTTCVCTICPSSAAKFILLAAVSSDDQQQVGIPVGVPEREFHVWRSSPRRKLIRSPRQSRLAVRVNHRLGQKRHKAAWPERGLTMLMSFMKKTVVGTPAVNLEIRMANALPSKASGPSFVRSRQISADSHGGDKGPAAHSLKCGESSEASRYHLIAAIRGLCLFVLGSTAVLAQSGIIAVDDAAKLIHGVNASVQYQTHQQTSASPFQNISPYMAPVLGAIKNGLVAGVNTANLVALHQGAVSNAEFVTTNLSPEEQIDTAIDFITDSIDPADWPKLGLDLVKAELHAYNSSQNISRGEVINPLQPVYIQQQVNNYYIAEMGDAYSIATSNPSFAQNFDQIFSNDLGVSVTSNAKTILNSNLNLPDYFRASVNPDGSLTVSVAGLENVYSQQSTAMTQAASNAVNLDVLINQYQQQSLFSNASLNAILQTVPAQAQQQAQQQYNSTKQSIATSKSMACATAACLVAEENADPHALWNPISDCPATVASTPRQTQISREAPYIICDACPLRANPI